MKRILKITAAITTLSALILAGGCQSMGDSPVEPSHQGHRHSH